MLRWEKVIWRVPTLDDFRVPSEVGAKFIENGVWDRMEREMVEQSAEITVAESLIRACENTVLNDRNQELMTRRRQ